MCVRGSPCVAENSIFRFNEIFRNLYPYALLDLVTILTNLSSLNWKFTIYDKCTV